MKILNVQYSNLTVPEVLVRIFDFLKKGERGRVCFLNFECLRQATSNETYRHTLDSADLVLSDGVGLKLTTRLFGGGMRDNCNGTDLSPLIIEKAVEFGYKIFLLGGGERVAEMAAENLRHRMPGIKIVGTYHGYFDDDEQVINKINDSGTDILFVGMGVPKQEIWIARNQQHFRPLVCLGVGALLDYLSGVIPRAPRWMRRCGLEWLWRIFFDPKRLIRRYLIDGTCFAAFLIYSRVRYGLSGTSGPLRARSSVE
ncbi:MAG: WecB/TagA/CpsF family glycosyltransferase [Luteolibacter sp.]